MTFSEIPSGEGSPSGVSLKVGIIIFSLPGGISFYALISGLLSQDFRFFKSLATCLPECI